MHTRFKTTFARHCPQDNEPMCIVSVVRLQDTSVSCVNVREGMNGTMKESINEIPSVG